MGGAALGLSGVIGIRERERILIQVTLFAVF